MQKGRIKERELRLITALFKDLKGGKERVSRLIEWARGWI